MPVSVAIVGSGPAGFYAAQSLLDSGLDVEIDLIDRLPTPFGLIRSGVAPDHQTTKKVQRKFEKTALSDKVRFLGNVEVGRDLSLDELRGLYDAVVLAIGAPGERALGIPGDDKKGVHGSATIAGWYNGHPDFQDLAPDLNVTAAAVIGVGNVAIDVARVLVKNEAEMAASDLPDYARRAVRASPITDVHIVGRRGPIEAKFTNVELREMGELEDCAAVVDAAALPADVGDLADERERRLKARNLETLRGFTGHDTASKPKRVHFRFFAAPIQVLGGDCVEGLRLEETRIEDGRAVGTGRTFDIECGLVVAAIGYQGRPIPGAAFDEGRCIIPNDDGRVADGLYCVGWIKRGPTGVISSNRPDGKAVAAHIVADCQNGGKPGRAALTGLLGERGVRVVGYAEWKKIEAAEAAAATPPAPRCKFTTIAEMLAVLDGG